MKKIEVYQIEANTIHEEISKMFENSQCSYYESQSYGTDCYDLFTKKEIDNYNYQSIEDIEKMHENGEWSQDIMVDLKYLIHKGVFPEGDYLVEISY